MRLLLHVCCACCLAKALAGIRTAGWGEVSVTGFWYNPNIHPLLEYRRRLKALRVLMERIDTPVEIHDQYGLAAWCAMVHPTYDAPQRCEKCYAQRLAFTAAYAAENGFDAFTSTLITSTHQSHESICAAGEAAAAAHGVAWRYADLRMAEPEAKLLNGIYHQQYCGCVFSEKDRYENTTKHLYRGDVRRMHE